MSEYERVVVSGDHPNPDFNANIIGWKIFYNDSTIYSSQNGSWNAAPSINVAIIILFYDQTFPIYINNVEETHNYRVILDEGKYFWSRVVNNKETFGQCEATDSSMPIDPLPGEIKTWNSGPNYLNFKEIWNNAYQDVRW